MKKEITTEYETCRNCGGSGKIRLSKWTNWRLPCKICDGSGRVVKKVIEVVEDDGNKKKIDSPRVSPFPSYPFSS
jgi:DnaJ-class molecular chaperone